MPKPKTKPSKAHVVIAPSSWVFVNKYEAVLPRDYHGTCICGGCGGDCEQVPGTTKERREYGCGTAYRDCCNVAFSCTRCGVRLVGSVAAPEME
jgi:hypothetical protein